MGEVIELATKNAKDAILWLLIEDGNPSRDNRSMFFDPDTYYMGSYTGFHKVNGTVTVINYLGGKLGPKLQTDNKTKSDKKNGTGGKI